MMEKGSVSYPWLGISGLSVTADLADELELAVEEGVYVVEVVSDSPADKADLKAAQEGPSSQSGLIPQPGGDVIIEVDNQKVKSVADISTYLETKEVGATVRLQVVRGERELTLEAKLAEWPEDLGS